MARPLVVGREARRVRRLGNLALEHLLEGVGTLARGVDVAHEMHFWLFWVFFFLLFDLGFGEMNGGVRFVVVGVVCLVAFVLALLLGRMRFTV